MEKSPLSLRGRKAVSNAARPDLALYFEAVQRRYDPIEEPDGTFPLNVAENKLVWHLLKEKIENIQQTHTIPDWVSSYTSTLGNPEVRAVIGEFLEEHLFHQSIHPDQIGLSAGASSIIELTTWILADPGEVVVFPAPAYPVYKHDIGSIGNLERFDLITHNRPEDLSQGPCLTIDHLEQTKSTLVKAGKKFKILILTAPDNPTGIIYPQSLLLEIAEWCISEKIHLIVNEIYGLSLIDTGHPAIRDDYDSLIEYQSFAGILRKMHSDYLHIWYAFSKDFGISGFRIGILYSLNEKLLKAFENINLSHCVSNHTQWILQQVLSDRIFVKEYIKQNKRSLTLSYVEVINTLKELDIPYSPAYGSLFVWINLSQFLSSQDAASEEKFWHELYENTGILLTPGMGFGHQGYGYFRMVYPFVKLPYLRIALKRFKEFIKCR